MSDYVLFHHGIKGQKWGRRRFQNEDGSLTDAGEKRYGGVKGALRGGAAKIYDINAKTYDRLGNKTLASMNRAKASEMRNKQNSNVKVKNRNSRADMKAEKAKEKQIYKEYRQNVIRKSAFKTGPRSLAAVGVGAGVAIGSAPVAGVSQYARRRIESDARKSAARDIEKKYGKQTMKSINDKQLRRDIAPVLVSAAFMGMSLAAYYNEKKE